MIEKKKFIHGLELSEMFYLDIVQPILKKHFLEVTYSAALIGAGSEVLGFDTEMSTDHSWGPRLQIFLSPKDFGDYQTEIDSCLKNELPFEFKGYPVNFSDPDPEDSGSQVAEIIDSGSVNHLIEIFTIESFLEKYFGMNSLDNITSADWLIFPEQVLLEVTSGKVFHDGLHNLQSMREKLEYYPHDVWLYKMASQWKRIAQEEPFIGRCGDLGDELGSRMIASKLVRDIMRLCFLQERKYAPYSKWFGTAFLKLNISDEITPALLNVLSADNWVDREKHICDAFEMVAEKHNKLVITDPIDTQVRNFHDRPFKVIDAERFTVALKAAIKDELLKDLNRDIGGVDQFVDSTDVLSYPEVFRKLKSVYE